MRACGLWPIRQDETKLTSFINIGVGITGRFFFPGVQFGFQLAAFRGKDPSLSNGLLSREKYR